MSRAAEILELLGERPHKAAELASALGCDRQSVNALLYGALAGRVEQDRASYRWRLKSRAETHASPPPRNRRAGLFAYYLDCLAADAGVSVSVFATSKFELDYAQLDAWPATARAVADWRDAENVRKLAARQRRQSRTKALWLGWPTYIRRARSRTGWEGAFVMPLVLWPVDADGDGLRIGAEPVLNGAALERLLGEDAAAGAVELAGELGLEEADELDPADLGERLRRLHPEWPWRDAPDPAALADAARLNRSAVASGLHNAAVVVLADRANYTAGLEAELKQLGSVPDADLARSALGRLLAPGDEAAARADGPILEVTPLNAEQREAVAMALAQPVTVVTGPPGTGKSQVVTAILANAAYRGERVLFASKNNQAVDVVETRTNALTSRPLLLRLGARAAQGALADRLMRLLSARVDASSQERGIRAAAEVARLSAALTELDARAEELRRLANDLAVDDARLAGVRERLGPDRWSALGTFDGAAADAAVATLLDATDRAERERQTFPVRLFWPLLRSGREAALAEARRGVLPLATALALPADAAAGRLADAVARAGEVRALWDRRARLATLGSAATLAGERSALQGELRRESVAALEGWLAGLAARLTGSQRETLGDYIALLRQVSAAAETNTPVSKQLWASYYRLADAAAGALPGWAVTSLSAKGRVPFGAAAFDLVVIDEASQCDIASVLPLLFRAKRAVVIGDPMQLSHITKLSAERDAALMARHGVLDDPGPGWSYGKASLYALAASRVAADAVVQLRDHHRSHPAIVGFSNTRFYSGTLRVATDYARLERPDGPAVRWIDVRGAVVRPPEGGAVNDAEAVAVVAELSRLVLDAGYKGTIGVVTPFRAQGRRIRELVDRSPALAQVLAARDFLAETADKYQGDERDLMIFSPVLAPGMASGARGFLGREANRFNVALTRARAAVIVVGDRAACVSGEVPLLADYAAYVAGLRDEPAPAVRPPGTLDYPPVDRPEQVSDFERDLYRRLARAGLHTIPQHPVDQYRLDLALIGEGGRRLDIEVDGERYHRDPWTGERLRRDQLRDMRLMEMGWDVLRFWAAEVRDRPDACVAAVAEWASRADRTGAD